MSPRTVLVLGASGFIGGHVARALAAQGGRVVAAGRSPGPGGRACDVASPQSLTAAFAGVDAVVNCYRDSDGKARSAAAIRNVLDACRANGVRRLVYLSSIAVYGGARGLVDEDTPPAPPLNWYGEAKRDAERACLALAADDFRPVIVRPSLVYGPGSGEWSLRFMEAIRRGYLLDLGERGEGEANLVPVGDLARFCAGLALDATAGAETYVVNGPPTRFNDYFRALAAAMGVAPGPSDEARRVASARGRRLARAPLKLGRGLAPLLGSAGARLVEGLDRRLAARPEDNLDAFAGGAYYSPARARAAGLADAADLSRNAAEVVAWARAEGRI